MSKEDKKAFAFAKCDADSKDNIVCGMRLPVDRSKAVTMERCPGAAGDVLPWFGT